MVAPRFYIFGVPDGFDMLEGTRQEISYFQRFYDGSTEDTKFTSHRDSNGNVTYTFLKYNLSSGKSRTGSFFGMSLAFSGVYCNHPLRLYELFDYVYQNHVLCNTSDASKGILKPIANSDIKAQYLITRFEDRKEHITFVEKVFQHNLATDDMLMTSFYPLDPGFKNEKQNLGVNLPLTGTNDDVLIASLRAYKYVTISPNWVKDDKPPRPEIPLPEIEYWKQIIPSFQDYIIGGLGDLMSVRLNVVQNYQKQTEDRLYQLRNNVYNKNNAPTLETDYEKLRNQLADLYQKASDAQNRGGEEPLPPPPLDSNPPKPTPIPSFWERAKEWVIENKSKVAGIIGAAAVVVVLLALVLPKLKPSTKTDPNPSYCCTDSVNNLINNALTANDFIKANGIADTISDKDFREEKLAMIGDRLSKYHTNLGKEIDQLIGDKKWKEAFDKTGQYFDEDAKRTKKAEIQTVCVDDFITKIGELKENNYTSKSKQLIRDLDNVKDYIGDNYNSLKKNIEDKKPKVNPPINTPQYVVEIYTADRLYHQSSLYETIRSTQNIKVTSSDNYIIKIKKGDKYLTGSELSNAISIPSESTQSFNFTDKQQGRVRMFLQAQSVTFTVNNNIVITIEK